MNEKPLTLEDLRGCATCNRIMSVSDGDADGNCVDCSGAVKQSDEAKVSGKLAASTEAKGRK
jgi:hypothetical protein